MGGGGEERRHSESIGVSIKTCCIARSDGNIFLTVS